MSVKSLAICPSGPGGMYLLAGTINTGTGGGIWRRALSEMILVTTTLTAQALAGSQALEVESINGFNIGDDIKINPGGPNEETNTITGFGSLLLQTPLQFDHSIGEIVLNLTPTSVEENNSSVPLDYVLFNNYPNPFNPSTIIRYSIPNQSKVVIKVYDILGKEIETLVNETKPVGIYELTWNAASLPSGVYYYQLRAGDFIQVKKMMLLK
ncbi:MAG: T9SS type A sorting domain-containing protein [Ignavibacteriaceae bacterium]|nr:T9SS type A sorting domain-containing protein [Ignavibacteriaceae bacterium]